MARGILAALTIKLSADSASLKKDFDKAKKDGREWGSEMGAAAGNVAKAFAAAGVAAGAAMGAMALKAIESQDKVGKFAERIGSSAEAVSRLQFAASRAGVATSVMDKGLEVISKRVAEAAQGTGESVQAFNALNLSAEKLKQLSPDKQFAVMADALNQVENSSQKTMLAMKLFGDEGAALLQVTQEGSAGLAALATESDRLGATVTTQSAKMAAEAADAIDNMKAGFGGITNQLATEFAPAITKTSQFIADNLPQAIDFVKVAFHALARAGKNVFDTIVAAAQTVGGTIYSAVAVPIAGLTDLLASSMESLGIAGAETMRTMANNLDAGAKKSLEYSQALLNVGQRYEENNRVYQEAIDKIAEERAVRTAQLQATQAASIALSDYTGKNLSKAESDKMAAAAAKQHADAIKQQEQEMQQLLSRANSMWESVRTPQEQYQARLAEINALEEAGAMSAMRAMEVRNRMAEQQLQNSASMQAARGMLAGIGDMTGQADPMAAAQMEWEGKRAAMVWMLEQEMITRQEFDALRIEAELQKETAISQIAMQEATRRAQFERMTSMQQTQFVIGQMVTMTAGLANHSKKMFALNKAAGIANAIINTATGITKALAEFPPPVNFVMAALTAAAGIAQINAIRSAKFGGGTTPSVAGSVPTYNNVPVTNGNSQNTAGEGPGGGNSAVNVTVNIGKVDASEGITADNLADKIQTGVMKEVVVGVITDHINNDGIIIPANSRQAAIIPGGG